MCLCPLVFRNYNTLFVSVSVEGMHFDTCVIMLAGTLNFALTENKLFFFKRVYIYNTCISYILERAGLKGTLSQSPS